MKLYLLIVTQFIVLNGFSQKEKLRLMVIPGPAVNVGYNEAFSAGIGFHLDLEKMYSAGRMGHWRVHDFLLDYDWNYFFENERHLSEELGLTYFYSYIGLFKSAWKPFVNVRFSHHTNFADNSFAFSPSIGMTYAGLLEFRTGYCFYFEQPNALSLNNAFTAGIFFRPLMKNHWAIED